MHTTRFALGKSVVNLSCHACRTSGWGELSSEEKAGLLQVGARRTRERVAALLDADIHAKGKVCRMRSMPTV